MATYTSIPNGNLDPDSPVRSVDGLALRDNPIAIAEGAAGAPRIERAAWASVSTGSIECWKRQAEVESDSTSYVTLYKFAVFYPGDYTFEFEFRIGNTGTGSFRMLKNSTTTEVEESTTSTTYVSQSVTASISAGDVIELQAKNSAGSANPTDIRNIVLSADERVPIINDRATASAPPITDGDVAV